MNAANASLAEKTILPFPSTAFPEPSWLIFWNRGCSYRKSTKSAPTNLQKLLSDTWNERKKEMFFDKEVKYSRKSFWNDDVTNYYDKNGRKIGSSRKSLWNDDKTVYYDENGKKVGTSRRSLWNEDRTDYYDDSNEKTGYSRKSLWDDGSVNYYDRNHHKTGRSRKSLLDEDKTIYKKR